MRYVITASKLTHLRSESVDTAAHGIEVASDFADAGFKLLSILDERYHPVTLQDLSASAIDEARDAPGERAS